MRILCILLSTPLHIWKCLKDNIGGVGGGGGGRCLYFFSPSFIFLLRPLQYSFTTAIYQFLSMSPMTFTLLNTVVLPRSLLDLFVTLDSFLFQHLPSPNSTSGSSFFPGFPPTLPAAASQFLHLFLLTAQQLSSSGPKDLLLRLPFCSHLHVEVI